VLTQLEVAEVLSEISYKDWNHDLIIEPENAPPSEQFMFLRFWWNDPNDHSVQTSRRWYISPHSTKSEVVQTALLAVLVAEEHETREQFRYKGAKIFGPHFDVDVMTDISKKKVNLDLRTPVGV